MKKVNKCCICKETFIGWGNNPWGALDKNGNEIKWKESDQCCDSCNYSVVLAGRFKLIQKNMRG